MLTKCKIPPKKVKKKRKKKVVYTNAQEENGLKRELLSLPNHKKYLKVILELTLLLKLKSRTKLNGHGKEVAS